MQIFIVRVQLSHETSTDYALLTDRLLKIGFTDRIKNEDGIEYRLPTGNYLIEKPDSNSKAWVSQVVINAVLDFDRKVGKASMVLITEAKEKRNFWWGLQKC